MGFFGSDHIWLILILLVVVLIIWGPGKLPDVGAGLGRAIREFRKASTESTETFRSAMNGDPTPPPARASGTTVVNPAPAPPAGDATPASPEEHPVSN